MISVLTADKLACARGGRTVFSGLSFRVSAGQALAVEGANGAGKTSLLRLLAGFIAPASGRVILKTSGDTGVSENDDAEARGQSVGWLGHQDGLKPQLSVIEQLTFFARLYQASRPRAHAAGLLPVLEQVGLSRQHALPCRYLSAGQKRRLGLARLLVSHRPLWLLDEPFSTLDADGQRLVARLIALHCGQGGIVIAATHDPLGLGNQSIRL